MSKKKTILITGANRGIGFQAAKTFAEQGHRVILTGRDLEKVRKAAESISGNTMPLQMDVTDENQVKVAAEHLKENQTTINVLINNAGTVFDERWDGASADDPLPTSLENLRKTFELNTIGAYSVTKALFPLIDKTERADIINVSSGMGSMTDMGGGVPAYRFSKTALNSMSVYLAGALANTTIHVNALCPGWVRTELGGEQAERPLEEGVIGLDYIVNEEPQWRGQFIRDKEVIPL